VTPEQAKEILLLYRPGTADAEDLEMIEAVALARQEPELGRWFDQHRAYQTAMRAKFRELEAPEHLKLALLAGQRNILPPPVRAWWRQPVVWAAAAALVLLLGLVLLPRRPPVLDRFANYRETMVAAAVRGYNMEWQTANMEQLRSSIGSKGAPADYQLSTGLQQLNLLGGAVLHWRGHPVTMLCFGHGTGRSWLFVMKTSGLPDPPAPGSNASKVSQLYTAGWSHGDDTYLLATEEADLAKFLPAL
jgi:hypothetical protein